MDILSIIGVILGIAALIGGNFLEGGTLATLANGPAALIVFGGTIGAAVLHTPGDSIRRAIQILSWVLWPPKRQIPAGIKTVVKWSQTARKEGLLGLENIAEREKDDFCKKRSAVVG